LIQRNDTWVHPRFNGANLECRMTAQEHPYSRVEMLIDIFGDWLKRRRELSEIRQMDSADFDRDRERAARFSR
jgi:hypothetical protein